MTATLRRVELPRCVLATGTADKAATYSVKLTGSRSAVLDESALLCGHLNLMTPGYPSRGHWSCVGDAYGAPVGRDPEIRPRATVIMWVDAQRGRSPEPTIYAPTTHAKLR